MLNEFLETSLYGFFMVFARVGTAMALLPGFSAGYVPLRIRLGIALAVTFALVPVLLGTLPPLPKAPIGLGLLVAGEVIIGGFMFVECKREAWRSK